MKSTKIQERNREISKMLGWKYENEVWLKEHPHKKGMWIIASYTDNFVFDSDWNWLMEAVEFIQKIIVKNGEAFRIEMYEDVTKDRRPLKTFVSCGLKEVSAKNPIEAVFITVSDFAKLYNKGMYF